MNFVNNAHFPSNNADMSVQTSPPQKKKRKRTIIPPEDMEKLEALFAGDQWPSRATKEALAREMDKSEHFVSIWFQNRRARARRDGSEMWNRMMNAPALDVPGMSLIQENTKTTVVGCRNEVQVPRTTVKKDVPLGTKADDGTKLGELLKISASKQFPGQKVMKIMVKSKDAPKEHGGSEDCEPPGKIIRLQTVPETLVDKSKVICLQTSSASTTSNRMVSCKI